MVFHIIQRRMKTANDPSLRFSVLLLFFVGSKAYRERVTFVQDFYQNQEVASLLDEATIPKPSKTDGQPHQQNMGAQAVELGFRPHTQLGMALDGLNHKIGGFFPWNGDDMARTLFVSVFLILLACILGSFWRYCSRAKSESPRTAGKSNQHRSENNSFRHTESESNENELEGIAAELQTLAHRLPAEVQKCPKHWTTSLFKGMLDRYIAIVPDCSSESSTHALQWRHAHLTMWGSKDEYHDGVRPKSSMPVLHIAELRIVHEIPSIWMSDSSRAIVLSNKHTPEDDELTLILEKKSAELFYATLRQYLDKLEHAS